MWRSIAMCLALGTMVGCGGAGEPGPQAQPETQDQAGAEQGDEVAAPLRDQGPPQWDGTPCDDNVGTAVYVGDQVILVPSECDRDYVDHGDAESAVNPAPEMGWES